MIYVDELADYGWRLGQSCHMYTDPTDDLFELHAMARKIGLKTSWFQHKPGKLPHYDLVKSKREYAVSLGARTTSKQQIVDTMNAWREFQIKRLKEVGCE